MTTHNHADVKRLTQAFKTVLAEWLTPLQLVTIDTTNNARRMDATCATHDYCDANMAMLEAVTRVFPDRAAEDLQNEMIGGGPIYDVVETAWTIAKMEGFYQPASL